MASECHMALQEIVVARYGKLSGQHRRRRRLRHADRRRARGARAGARGRRRGRLRRAGGLRPRLRRHAPVGPADAALLGLGPHLLHRASSSTSTRSWCATSAWPRSRTPSTRTTGRASPPSRRELPGVQIVGDDLLVTDPQRVRTAVELRRRQRPAVEGQPDRHADRGFRGGRRRAARRLRGLRERALGRDRRPGDRRPGRGPQLRADQDRLAGARRAHGQVQPPAADRGVAGQLGRLPGPRLSPAGDGTGPGDRRLSRGAPSGNGVLAAPCPRHVPDSRPAADRSRALGPCAPTPSPSPRPACGRPIRPPRSAAPCASTAIAWSWAAGRIDGLDEDGGEGDTVVDLAGRRLFLLGAGKATLGMAAVFDRLLGPRFADAAVVVKRGEAGGPIAAPRRGARGGAPGARRVEPGGRPAAAGDRPPGAARATWSSPW